MEVLWSPVYYKIEGRDVKPFYKLDIKNFTLLPYESL